MKSKFNFISGIEDNDAIHKIDIKLLKKCIEHQQWVKNEELSDLDATYYDSPCNQQYLLCPNHNKFSDDYIFRLKELIYRFADYEQLTTSDAYAKLIGLENELSK
jgi:hypothetical protein